MGIQRPDFAEFYRETKDECLFAVLVSVGDRETAQELVAEAFARAWASWPAVSRHPAPVAWVVRTALNAGVSRWRRRRREVPVPDLALVADRPAAGGAVGDHARHDPAALQATLRADGVPVSVTFIGQQNPACQPYSSSGSPAHWPFGSGAGPLGRPNKNDFNNTQDALVINPAALPSGAGLQIAVMRGIPSGPSGPWPYPKGSGNPVVEVFLVKASPQCTGSKPLATTG